MHAVVRTYTGKGAKELIGLIEKKKSEIENLLSTVSGFVSYTCCRSEDGGFTVSVADSKAGTDQSIQIAKDWIGKNAGSIGAQPPQVSEGQVVIHKTKSTK